MPVDKEKVVGTEEAVARIGMEFLSPDKENVPLLTDLTPKEIFILTALKALADFYDSKIIDKFILTFMKLRVSRYRIGRKELILFATGLKELEEEKRKGKQLSSLFAGLS
jgi:hypothetical protein